MKKKLVMSLVAALVATVCLSSCSTSNESDVPGEFLDISLAESKSPTQLLRNATSGRIPSEAVSEVVASGDVSVACLPSDADPEETVRSWQSSVQVSLTDQASDRLDQLVGDLVASYEEQGWSISALGGTGRGGSKLLFSDSAPQSIQVVGLQPNDVRPEVLDLPPIANASIIIVVIGPCVRTDGLGSDEVDQLQST